MRRHVLRHLCWPPLRRAAAERSTQEVFRCEGRKQGPWGEGRHLASFATIQVQWGSSEIG